MGSVSRARLAAGNEDTHACPKSPARAVKAYTVAASDDGSSWTMLKEIDTSDTNPSNYLSKSFNLSGYMSSSFRIRLRLDSKDSVGNDPGWWVNDIEVTAN